MILRIIALHQLGVGEQIGARVFEAAVAHESVVGRVGNGGQNGQQKHHNHKLGQGEAVLQMFHIE